MASALVFACSVPAFAVDCTWIAGDGDWDVAANWDCGVIPGTDDNATIDTPGVTVTVPEVTLLTNLTLIDATLNVVDELKTQNFHFESGTVSGGGLLVAGILSMDGSGRTLGEDTTIVLTLQGEWISGSIGINNNAEIAVWIGAELELSSGADFTGSAPNSQPAFLVIEEGGTFRRTGSGTSLFNSMRVVNHGTFIVGNTQPDDSNPAVAFQSQNGFPHTGRFEVLDDGLLHFQIRSDHTEDAELVGTGVVAFSGTGSHTFEGDGYNFDGLTQPLPGSQIVFQNGANASTGSLYIANAAQLLGQTGTPPQGMNPTFTVHGSFITEGNQVRFRNNLHIHALDGFDISTALLQLETNAVLFNHGEGNLAYTSEFRLGAVGPGANQSTLHNMPGATLNFLTNAPIRSASGFPALGGIIFNEGEISVDPDPDDKGLEPLNVYGQRIINRGGITVFSAGLDFHNEHAALLLDDGAITYSVFPTLFVDGASLGGNGDYDGSVTLEGGRLRTAEGDADILPLDEPVLADIFISGDFIMDENSAVVARLFGNGGPGVGHDFYSAHMTTLDGTLQLSQDESFDGSGCDTYTVLSSNNDFVGNFASIDILDGANLAAVTEDQTVDVIIPDGQSDVVGDLNCDGVVDSEDLFILLAAWGECFDPDDCPADLDDNDVVDAEDLFILLANWG